MAPAKTEPVDVDRPDPCEGAPGMDTRPVDEPTQTAPAEDDGRAFEPTKQGRRGGTGGGFRTASRAPVLVGHRTAMVMEPRG